MQITQTLPLPIKFAPEPKHQFALKLQCVLAFLAASLGGELAHADFTHDDFVHLAAHTGSSFALQTAFYGLNKKILKMNPTVSEVVAFIETMTVGYIYKFSENAGEDDTFRAMSENALGAGLAIGAHITLHF